MGTRVSRVWPKVGLELHRMQRYQSSRYLDVEPKVAERVGLYWRPPVRATVSLVDEKSAMEALNTENGKLSSNTVEPHASGESVLIVMDIVVSHLKQPEIHSMVDDL